MCRSFGKYITQIPVVVVDEISSLCYPCPGECEPSQKLTYPDWQGKFSSVFKKVGTHQS